MVDHSSSQDLGEQPVSALLGAECEFILNDQPEACEDCGTLSHGLMLGLCGTCSYESECRAKVNADTASAISQTEGLTPLRPFQGGHSTDGADPMEVEALSRRIMRPLRTEAKLHGYALSSHGSMTRDIDLIAVPWTQDAKPVETLIGGLRSVLRRLYPVTLEVGPNLEHPKPHGRLCFSFWIRPWTYIDLSVMPPTDGPKGQDGQLRDEPSTLQAHEAGK